MADKTLDQLTERTSFSASDLLYMVAGDSNYKAELGDILANLRKDELLFVMDGGGSAIGTGIQSGALRVPYDCTITAAYLALDQSATMTVDIWKDTWANYPPTDADTICGGSELGSSAAQKGEETDPSGSGWTVSLSAGDWLFFNVDANDNATWAAVVLAVEVDLP